MKIWKKSGYLFIATGIIHNLIGLIMGWEILKQIAQSGLINSINNQMDRNAIFWFLFSGFLMMIIGELMQNYINQNEKPVPKELGWYLLILSGIGCIMMPQSGFWTVLPQALIIILAKNNPSYSPQVK